MGETIAAGGLQFFLENRIVGEDGGPSLQVLAEVEQQMVQLLRFDMFYKQPHYHYAPNGQNIRYNLDPLAFDDCIGWVMSLLRSKLPQLVAKAGQDGLLSTDASAAVVASLPLIEARWRAQEPVRVMNSSN
jgi:hypothetical protein